MWLSSKGKVVVLTKWRVPILPTTHRLRCRQTPPAHQWYAEVLDCRSTCFPHSAPSPGAELNDAALGSMTTSDWMDLVARECGWWADKAPVADLGISRFEKERIKLIYCQDSKGATRLE